MIDLDGQPWFVAADAARVLYGTTYGLRDTYARIEPPQQRVVTRAVVLAAPLFDGNSAPKVDLLSEGGLYTLIFNSKLPSAKAFKVWVTDAVLPAIRKDGAYIAGEEKVVTDAALAASR